MMSTHSLFLLGDTVGCLESILVRSIWGNVAAEALDLSRGLWCTIMLWEWCLRKSYSKCNGENYLEILQELSVRWEYLVLLYLVFAAFSCSTH